MEEGYTRLPSLSPARADGATSPIELAVARKEKVAVICQRLPDNLDVQPVELDASGYLDSQPTYFVVDLEIVFDLHPASTEETMYHADSPESFQALSSSRWACRTVQGLPMRW